MQDATINVLAQDRIVNVNGEVYLIDASHFPAGLISMSWRPNTESKTKGHLAKKGDSYGFDDFAEIAPFIAPWQAAKAAYEAADAERLAAEAKMRALKP
jgi:hypothetical protein